jgi:F-type H+-transporting ATPase subunit b
MEKLLSLNPGLLFWTIVNFLVFLSVFILLFKKPILDSLKNREQYISDKIESAESKLTEAEAKFAEAETRITEATKEVTSMISKEREIAAEIISKAKSEAEKIRQEKLDNAVREIQIAQDKAFQKLKQEVAGMVVQATEKIISEKLTSEKDFELINQQIEKLSKN